MFKRLAAAAMAAVLLTVSPAYGGQWIQDEVGWRWQEEDGSCPYSCWMWLDGNRDGIAERYYFGGDGYMFANKRTPDGRQVDGNGAWIENGTVQTEKTEKATENTIAMPMTDQQYAQLEAFINQPNWYTRGDLDGIEEEEKLIGDTDPYELADLILEMVNEERVKKGREPLAVNHELMEIAVMRAEEADYCAPHTRPDGSRYITAVPFSDYVGENLAGIAYGTRNLEETAKYVVNGWMSSSDHKKNILNVRYKETGTGVYIQGSKMNIIQLFID